MKKLIILIALAFSFVCSQAQTSGQGYFAVLDTLTNADSHSDTITLSGNKHAITFQSDLIKLTGTVAGFVRYYGSVQASPAKFVLLYTDTLSNATANYGHTWAHNGYARYIVTTNTTGTSTASVRQSYLYRKE